MIDLCSLLSPLTGMLNNIFTLIWLPLTVVGGVQAPTATSLLSPLLGCTL